MKTVCRNIEQYVPPELVNESPCEFQNESVNESQNESQNESVNESPCESQNESPCESQNESVNEFPCESVNEFPCESVNESQNESPCESQNESPCESQNESPCESQNESPSENVEVDLGNTDGIQLTYYEENDISFISVSKDNAVIDEVRAKLVSASKIKGIVKSGKIDELKDFIPSEPFELFRSEFNKAKPKIESQEERNKQKQTMIDSINKLRESIKNKEHRKAEYEKELKGLNDKHALPVRTSIRKLFFDIRKDKFSLTKIESEFKRL